MRHATFETAAGPCGIAWSDAGVARFRLPGPAAPRALPGAPGTAPEALVALVRRYFDGEPVDLRDVAVDLGPQPAFHARVRALVRGLAWGETTTYGAVAAALGAGPEAAREVGQAMARNPVPLFVPCHRVLAAGGRVGGFSAPGGSAAKRRMLALEGVVVDETRQASFAF